jgi:hypothetical protein
MFISTHSARTAITTTALGGLVALCFAATEPADAASVTEPLPVPVSINALMVTMIDHSAHHVWDHQALERELSDEEWRIVEYFSIQLAGAGSLITLGGSGPADAGWAADEQWRTFSQAMSSAALIAMDAAKTKNKDLLASAGDALITSCQGCHDAFKPALPTEGIMHMPDYDHLYHLFE